jgi:hypothetical protein
LRSSIILLGDTVEDSKIVDAQDHETVLKIGVLNPFKEGVSWHRRNLHMNNYDVVIEGDGSLCPVVEILNWLDGEPAPTDASYMSG